MDLKQAVALALQVSIMTMVLGFGLRATRSDLLLILRRPALLARSLLSVFVVMPIATGIMIETFELVRPVEIALMALAISPVPPLLPGKERKAGGAMDFGVGLLVLLAALAIVAMPAALELLEWYFGVSLDVSPGLVANIALKTILGPLALGALIRAIAPAVAERLSGRVTRLASILLLLALLPVLFVELPAAWAMVHDGTVVAIVIFIVIGLTAGHVLGGPDPHEASVLALATASRHPAIAFAVASANFPDERFGGVIVLYLITGAIVTVPYVMWQRRRAAASS